MLRVYRVAQKRAPLEKDVHTGSRFTPPVDSRVRFIDPDLLSFFANKNRVVVYC